MRKLAHVDGEQGGHEAQGQEDDGDDCEDHDGLALARGAGGLVACEAGLEGVGVLLLEVEEVGDGGVDAGGLGVEAGEVGGVVLEQEREVLGGAFERRLARVRGGVDVVEERGEQLVHGALVVEHLEDHGDFVADIFDLGEEVGFVANVEELVDEEGRVRRAHGVGGVGLRGGRGCGVLGFGAVREVAAFGFEVA